MGVTSQLLLLDVVDLHARVVPAVRAWLRGAGLPDLRRSRSGEAVLFPGRRPSERGFSRDAWPALLAEPAPQPPRLRIPLLPLPARALDETTREAVTTAVLTAATGGVRLGKGTWLALDVEDALHPGPELLAVLDDLDNGWKHVQVGDGGYGEGLRGALTPAEVVALDKALVARGSTPFLGTPPQIQDLASDTLTLLHSMARHAGRQGMGLLHGRDLDRWTM